MRTFAGVPALVMCAAASALTGGWHVPATAAPARTPGPARELTTRASHAVPAYCGRGGPGLWANLAACGWPGPGSTGPSPAACPGGKLTPLGTSPVTPVYIRQAGTVISCAAIRGMVIIQAPNVTVTNSSVIASSGLTGMASNGTAGIKVGDGASAAIDHVSVDGSNGVQACVFDLGTALKVTALDCYHVREGVFSWADTAYSQTTGDNVTLTGSYFHDFTPLPNLHEDGYQTEGAAHGLIQHNTFQMGTHSNAAISIWDGLRSSSDFTVSGNLITGGGFSVYAQDYSPASGAPGSTSAAGGFSVTGIQFLGNSFSTYASGCVGRWGAWFTRPSYQPYRGGPTDGWHRSGNRVLETGENIDAGNPHSNGVLCS